MNDPSYKTGYKKPPRRSQFKKGSSGNPSGRPKARNDFVSALVLVLQQKITAEQNGRKCKLSKLQAIVIRLMNRAVKGDIGAIKLLSRYHLRRGSLALERKSPKVRVVYDRGE